MSEDLKEAVKIAFILIMLGGFAWICFQMANAPKISDDYQDEEIPKP